MFLLGLLVVIGMRVVGGVLMTALLVLPGATAMLVSQRFSAVIATAVGSSLIAAVMGLILNAQWAFFPVGPSIVLVMVAEFVAAYLVQLVRPRR